MQPHLSSSSSWWNPETQLGFNRSSQILTCYSICLLHVLIVQILWLKTDWFKVFPKHITKFIVNVLWPVVWEDYICWLSIYFMPSFLIIWILKYDLHYILLGSYHIAEGVTVTWVFVEGTLFSSETLFIVMKIISHNKEVVQEPWEEKTRKSFWWTFLTFIQKSNIISKTCAQSTKATSPPKD